MAISDDWIIDYTYKRIYHSSGTTVYTLNELYSYLMDVFDESGTIDEPAPMTAQTPTSYTLTNGWFINYASDTLHATPSPYPSFKFLKSGALTTSGWLGTAYATGIRILTFNSSGYTAAITTDIGKVVTNGSTQTGRLLDFDNTTRTWWVRQDALDDTFSSGSLTITSGTGAGTLTGAAVTGENLWANTYTLGTIETNTEIYLYQDSLPIASWWPTGHLDILVLVKSAGSFINSGYLTFYARQYSKLYDFSVNDVSSGGRNPIPLATYPDTNNPTGYRTFTGSAGADTFNVGNAIYVGTSWLTATAKGILTAVGGTVGSPILTYYLLGDLTDLSGTVYEYDFTSDPRTTYCTAGSPANTGPASIAGVTITFGAGTHDIDNGNGDRPYDVEIDCNGETIATVYEYLKYLTRRGSSTTVNGHAGEMYPAVGDIRLPYDAESSAFTEGLTLTGATSAAAGVIVSDFNDGTTGVLTLRDVVGTFQNNESITDSSIGLATANIPSGAELISPVKQAPFGTFAGGKFFGARGIFITNMDPADIGNYVLLDSENVEQTPPSYISLSITNVVSGDRIGVYEATGDNNIVNKLQYHIQASHSAGATYIRVAEPIPADTPASGSIRLVRRDGSLNVIDEQRYAYSSFSNTSQPTYSEFTLYGTTTVAYDTDDTAYVPYIDTTATATTLTETIVYTTNRFVTVRIRQKGYLPFISKGEITSLGLSVTAVKTIDTSSD